MPEMSKSARSAGKKPSKRLLLQHAVGVAQAKSHFLSLVNEVVQNSSSIMITKRGKAVAMLVPLEPTPPKDLFGCMRGSGKITGDIVGPEPDIWEAMR